MSARIRKVDLVSRNFQVCSRILAYNVIYYIESELKEQGKRPGIESQRYDPLHHMKLDKTYGLSG